MNSTTIVKTIKRGRREVKPVVAAHPVQPSTVTDEQINRRAHEIYLARGGADGMALNDWLQAEQELRRKLSA